MINIYKGESINLKNTIVDFELRNQIPVNNTLRRLAYRKESDYWVAGSKSANFWKSSCHFKVSFTL